MLNQAAQARMYLLSQLPQLCHRLQCGSDKAAAICAAFMAALDAGIMSVEKNLMAPMVEAIPESRELFNLLGDLVVKPESQLYGREHLAAALGFMASGGNVLMIQNHTSGADTVVWDRLVSREFPEVAVEKFGYMAGHVVNYFLLPMTMTAAMLKFQIFSSKYKGTGLEDFSTEVMERQNKAAMVALAEHCRVGGRLVGLYPEGGRGEGALLAGDPKTAKILEVMAVSSSRGLMVLPTYVSGATSILPVVRGPDEFERFIDHIRPGVANVICGVAVTESEMVPGSGAVAAYMIKHKEVTGHIAPKILIHAAMMKSIAALAPRNARGPWA